MKQTKPKIRPTQPQFDYITSKEKYPAFVAGFGAGKTEASIFRCLTGLIANKGVNRGFYEPTYDLIRMIAWPRFEAVLSELGLSYKLVKSPLNHIAIENYGHIFFRSMDNPARIVGYEHADADIDELDTLKRDDAAYAWRQIMARNRQHKPSGEPNTIGVTTTPEGFRFVYEYWKKNPRPGYKIIQAPTMSNPHLPIDYVDGLRASYPPHLLEAYLNGNFVNLTSGSVYVNYDRDKCMSHETVISGEPLYIGCDFNVTKQAATVYVVRQENGQHVWHAVDEFTNMYDTPDMIETIKGRYQGHTIYIYPDASGGARKTLNASLSDLALLEKAGFKIRVKSKNPAVKDRILAMNSALENQKVKINAYKCPITADCLEQQSYNDNGEPDKTSGVDHQNDATTYPIAYEMPIVKPVANIQVTFAT